MVQKYHRFKPIMLSWGSWLEMVARVTHGLGAQALILWWPTEGDILLRIFPWIQNVIWKKFLNWTAAWQNQQNDLCAQRRLRSALASAQSDQSSQSAWRNLGSLATYWVHCEDSVDAQADLSLRWLVMSCTGSIHTWTSVSPLCYILME